MPRPKRLCIPGSPHHVVQRGNDRQATFYCDNDYEVYLDCLSDAAAKHHALVHAYALMTNHAHLLITPATTTGLSLTMQTLGRAYVSYINKRYRRTGTLWEGRFKSSVVDSDTYCLTCFSYIELNPVRAKMVVDPIEYRWSSHSINTMRTESSLITAHSTYLNLASNPAARARKYRQLVLSGLSSDDIERIRYGNKKCLPVGTDRFKRDIETQLGRQLGSGRIGRPPRR